jgi:hypothetical protein
MCKLSLAGVSLILAAMAGACNYKAIVASRDVSGEGIPAKQPIDSVYLLGLTDNLPDSSSLLADVTLYSPLVWLQPYDYGHSAFLLMLDRAGKEAREMGGNAIQVIDCSAKKFARLKMVARIYSIKKPAASPPAASDSCIVHVKINWAGSQSKPVPVHLNDSLIGISKECVLAGHWQISYGPIAQPRVEQFSLESENGGWLSARQKSGGEAMQKRLKKGREYYVFVNYTSRWVRTGYFATLVSKEEFELDQLLW